MKSVEVTLHLSKDSLEALKVTLQRSKLELLAALEAIDIDLDNLDKAMNPVPYRQERWVISESDPNKSYLVGYFREIGQWDCTCPAYQFGKGVDYTGKCKHIRRVENERWFTL